MQIAKLFANGKSQAVRLPKEYRFEGDGVVVKRLGDAVILFPVRYDARQLRAILSDLEPGFQIEREQPRRKPKRRRLNTR